MIEKANPRNLAFACLLIMLFWGVQNMSAQDFGTGRTGDGKEEKPVIIEDEPGDTSRWAPVRDIFMSPADRKKTTAPGLIAPSAADDDSATETAFETETPENFPHLRGILVAGKSDYTALFSDKTRDLAVKKGDSINDFAVTKITRNAVTLEKNGKEIVLYVQE